MFCTVHLSVPSSPQPPAWKDRSRNVNADVLWAHDKVQNQIAEGLWSLNGINCGTVHFSNINVSQKTAQYDMKCNIFTIYRINQDPRQMGREFCWLDTPTLWELGYESVTASLFIAEKLTQIATHSHTHRGVKAKPVCEKINCACVEKKKTQKKITRA